MSCPFIFPFYSVYVYFCFVAFFGFFSTFDRCFPRFLLAFFLFICGRFGGVSPRLHSKKNFYYLLFFITHFLFGWCVRSRNSSHHIPPHRVLFFPRNLHAVLIWHGLAWNVNSPKYENALIRFYPFLLVLLISQHFTSPSAIIESLFISLIWSFSVFLICFAFLVFLRLKKRSLIEFASVLTAL